MSKGFWDQSAAGVPFGSSHRRGLVPRETPDPLGMFALVRLFFVKYAASLEGTCRLVSARGMC